MEFKNISCLVIAGVLYLKLGLLMAARVCVGDIENDGGAWSENCKHNCSMWGFEM